MGERVYELWICWNHTALSTITCIRFLLCLESRIVTGDISTIVMCRKKKKNASKCQVRCLSCLAIVCGIVALGSLALAVVSDQWVFTQEPIPLPAPRPTGQRLPGGNDVSAGSSDSDPVDEPTGEAFSFSQLHEIAFLMP